MTDELSFEKTNDGGQDVSSLETKGQSTDVFIATMMVHLLITFEFSLIDVSNESLLIKYVHVRLPCCILVGLRHAVV